MGLFNKLAWNMNNRLSVLLVFSFSLIVGLLLVLWALWPEGEDFDRILVIPLSGEVYLEFTHHSGFSSKITKPQVWKPSQHKLSFQDGALIRLELGGYKLECRGPGSLSGMHLPGKKFLLQIGETACFPLQEALAFTEPKLFLESTGGRVLDAKTWTTQVAQASEEGLAWRQDPQGDSRRVPEERLRLFSELLRPLWTKCYVQYLESHDRSALPTQWQIVVIFRYEQRTWHKPQLRSSSALPLTLRDCLLKAAEGFRVPTQDLKWLGSSFSLEVPLLLEGL